MLFPSIDSLIPFSCYPVAFSFSDFDERFRKMKMDVKEVEGGYKHIVDLPGFSKDEVDITLKDGYLTIKAETKKEEEKKEKYIRQERISRSLSRSVYVGDIPKESIKAKLKDGVLEVFVPKEKKEETEKTNIEIE